MPMVERRRSALGALGLLVGLAGVACDDAECQTSQDCESTEQCRAGTCEPKTNRVPPGMVDGGFYDAQPVDTGTTAGSVDAGPRPDLGSYDAGPLSRPDLGPYDGGIADATTLAGWGEVVVAESDRFGADRFGAWARFVDTAGVTFGVVTNTFNVSSGEVCNLIERRVLSGTLGGYTATSIDISFMSSAANMSMVPVSLTASVAPGAFGTTAMLSSPVFAGGSVQFTINSNAMNGTLGDFMTSVPAPQPIRLRSAGSLLHDWLGEGQINWTPAPTAGGTVRVEVYGVDRNVVLSCTTDDDGDFFVPDAVRQAFVRAGPTRPAFLEVSYDERAVASVPLVGGGNVSTTFRAFYGQRKQLQ